MLNENIELLNKRFDFREELRINPKIVDKLFCAKCNIRVLVVTDSFLHFGDGNFGLSNFITILEATSHPSANLIISKAHRGSPGDARLDGADSNFEFNDSSLTNIDIVFMFATSRSDNLPPNELKELAKFMDDGGGVFATGDHDSLGRAMCGDLMRVRSMRKWFWPNSGPFGEPIAPDGASADRHDTNRPGHDDPLFTFNDQSDDIPQEISPIYETVSRSSFNIIKEPHPILCGTNGVLKYLPDHPHEGECIAPWELDRIFEYDGSDFEEYPLASNGERPLPKIIATATMLSGAETAGKPPIPGGTFGVMSSYDGHLADVGRIHCDATWHHFINVNLTGDEDVMDESDPKTMGFLASESGEAYFELIKNYFRNIPIWLAPKSKQVCMRNRWLWNLVRRPEVQEDFGFMLLDNKKLSMIDSINIGRQINAFAKPNLSRCQVRRWGLGIVIPELEAKLPDIACLLDPCIPNPNPEPDPLPPFIDPDIFIQSALGNVVFDMMKESNKLETKNSLKAPESKKLDSMVKASSKKTLKLIGNELTEASKEIFKMKEKLEGL